MTHYDLVVGGGADDFNLARLIEVAQQLGVNMLPVLHRVDAEPSVAWKLGDDHILIDGDPVTAKAQFLRYDVFTVSPGSDGALDRGMGWYNTLHGWGMSSPDMRLYNRNIHHQAGLKPFTLTSAASAGLPIPRTLISNDEAAIRGFDDDAIVKPVAGGAYTRSVEKALDGAQITDGRMPMPATIQQKLVYPEYRTFVVGRTLHVFRLTSRYIDYRPAQDNAMEYIGDEFPSDAVREALIRLLDRFECDFCACDFKSDPETGEPVFLELNNGPMFAAFDACAEGALCRDMIGTLLG